MDKSIKLNMSPLAIALGLAAAASASSVKADTFVVTNLDGYDSNGSLRDAVQKANNNEGADNILFDVTGTIHLGYSLSVTDDLVITGPESGAIELYSGYSSEGEGVFKSLGGEGIISQSSGATLSISNVVISNSYDSAIDSDDELIVSNVSFINNGSTYGYANGGGAISHSAGDLTVTDSTFTGNRAGSYGGGAIYSNSEGEGGTTIITNSTFTGNYAYTEGEGASGGAVYSSTQTTMVTDSTFTGNRSYKSYSYYEGEGNLGGAIAQFGEGSKLTVSNSTFTDNRSDGGGGAIGTYGYDSTITINGSTISDNSTESGGGGVSVYGDDSSLIILNSKVSGNSAGSYGGGIGAIGSYSKLIVRNTVISTNGAGYVGGGVLIYGQVAAADLDNTAIVGNYAEGEGGGIQLGSSRNGHNSYGIAEFKMTNSVVVSNSAGYGGGINVNSWSHSNPAISIADSAIKTNSSFYNGGGILIYGEGFRNPATISRTTISDNHAGSSEGGGDGGGIHVYSRGNSHDEQDGVLTIEDSTISNNHASEDGGGISFDSEYSGLDIVNSTIVNNAAGNRGGGILRSEGSNSANSIAHSTISGNSAETGGGIHSEYSGYISIDHSVIAANTADSSSPDFYGENGVTMDNSLLGTDAGLEGYAGTNNLVGTVDSPINPLLGVLSDNGGPTKTRMPLAGSPLIDGGLSSVTVASDQRGADRTGGLATDIGAVESDVEEPASVETPVTLLDIEVVPPAVDDTEGEDEPTIIVTNTVTETVVEEGGSGPFGSFGWLAGLLPLSLLLRRRKS